MMDVSEIRRKNLELLVKTEGLSVVARKSGKPDRQINDIIARRKSFGEKVARAIEKNYAPHREQGWLDIDANTDQPIKAPVYDIQTKYDRASAKVRAAVDIILIQDRRMLSDETRSVLMAFETLAIKELKNVQETNSERPKRLA